MRFIGRYWLFMLLGLGVLAIIVLLLAGKDSPTQAGNEFLVALAKGKVDDLVNDSYYQGSKEDLRKQWEFATTEAGQYYRFLWRVKDERISSPTSASIQLGWVKNVGTPGAYEDNAELPMVKENGRWKVDVKAMSHDLYPALPH